MLLNDVTKTDSRNCQNYPKQVTI